MTAIDVHTHPQTAEKLAAMGSRREQMERYFGRKRRPVSFAEMAAYFSGLGVRAVIVNSTDQATSGIKPVPNDHIADAVAAQVDVFRGFGAVDPLLGEDAIREAERCATELGLIGIGELNPARQGFEPDDAQFDQLWATCADLGLIVIFHGGFPGAGAGTPGGMGYRLHRSRPIPHLAGVAAKFPRLTIIAAHPGWPWPEESLALVAACPNVYMDLSGWAPKYWPACTVRASRGRLAHKLLFGSDWPALTPERWLSEFDALDIPEHNRDLILQDNAARLLHWE